MVGLQESLRQFGTEPCRMAHQVNTPPTGFTSGTDQSSTRPTTVFRQLLDFTTPMCPCPEAVQVVSREHVDVDAAMHQLLRTIPDRNEVYTTNAILRASLAEILDALDDLHEDTLVLVAENCNLVDALQESGMVSVRDQQMHSDTARTVADDLADLMDATDVALPTVPALRTQSARGRNLHAPPRSESQADPTSYSSGSSSDILSPLPHGSSGSSSSSSSSWDSGNAGSSSASWELQPSRGGATHPGRNVPATAPASTRPPVISAANQRQQVSAGGVDGAAHQYQDRRLEGQTHAKKNRNQRRRAQRQARAAREEQDTFFAPIRAPNHPPLPTWVQRTQPARTTDSISEAVEAPRRAVNATPTPTTQTRPRTRPSTTRVGTSTQASEIPTRPPQSRRDGPRRAPQAHASSAVSTSRSSGVHLLMPLPCAAPAA
mmetsp:Transcript_6182/g.14772  ORF Transcript_6182/g.14772 Transcript_6182/m.14772 type:complete len:433 (-) Transcript_6182:256-1554(-)